MNKKIKQIIWKLYGLIDESYAFGNGESFGEATRLLKELEKELTIPVVGNLLKDKEEPTIKDAFIAGYKKRAEMSGLKYDDISELNAMTCFISFCWESFDL